MAEFKENNYWDRMRHFSTSRTNFWISLLFQLIATIIPFILLWIFIGADYKIYDFSLYGKLPNPYDGYVALILIGYVLWSLLITTITFFLKWQKADGFTFTVALVFVGFSVIMNGSWINDLAGLNQGMKIFIRFLIAIACGFIGIFIGVIITTYARNFNYKIEEDDQKILIAYRNGEEIPSRKQLQIKRAEKAHEKRLKEQEELEEFKKELDLKLIEAFNEKEKEKQDFRKSKLDAKEQKQRNRDKKRKGD
ncbi:DxFTY motif-containing membrane protein [Mesoplasma photuris]|uniref:DxFTY motif-containing membrane protein n=1 Tax=Mesoplasma photuris TaxID=217731 RepID=UPI0004E28029|nr:hypothetical protein [Mesoplasma photuris]